MASLIKKISPLFEGAGFMPAFKYHQRLFGR
jgi:hypothetical protein